MNLKLREYRESRGLTQQQLAKMIHKSFRTIQTWERGESYPNAEAVWNLCELFGCDPNDLVGWWDEHPRESEKPTFSDPRQRRMNDAYENMGEPGKDGASASVVALWEAERARFEGTDEVSVSA